MTSGESPAELEIHDHARAVYGAVVSAPGSGSEELRRRLGLPPTAFQLAVKQLVELGLLERAASEEAFLYPVTPATAVLRVCVPKFRAIAEEQRQMERLSSLIAAFAPVYTENLTRHTSHSLTERLVSLDVVRQTIAELAAGARSEALTSQPGGPRPEEQLKDSIDLAERALRRGVRIRTLYQQSAQFSHATTEYVQRVTRLGAQVRTVNDAFMRLIVFDRTTAVMSLRDLPQGALVVRDPDIVHFAVGAFERAWATSQPFPARYEKQQVKDASEAMKLSIMRLLAEGGEIGAIAKRLGVSHRTCQRHVSEIMHRLGARNRLHAGFLISQQGLLDGPDQPISSLNS
ncbi:LuxR C-terminal-related transcriptional regulator [Streptomyces sp. Edi4]|uniref:LuxR C-terminal-related transcriptional regulator n=1 Tax=Streptomyces sp. Edi4 TaxID=3162527 RepID=UPI003305A2C3